MSTLEKTPFDTEITTVFPRLKPAQAAALKRLGLNTVEDLLLHFPVRYTTISGSKPLMQVESGDEVVLFGTMRQLKATKSYRSKTTMATGRLEDATGFIEVVWFNQPYIAKMLPESSLVKLQGKVSERKGKPYIANPEFEIIKELPLVGGDNLFREAEKLDDEMVTTYYPESRGITSQWFSYNIAKLLSAGLHKKLTDPIPENVLKELSLPDIATALVWLHQPKQVSDATIAKKRFAFQEIFCLQVVNAQELHLLSQEKSYQIKHPNQDEVDEILPFSLTAAQARSVDEILSDLESDTPMNRLLEGDVGSGKTAVAAIALQASLYSTGEKDFEALQAALMAPTEILARQHFEKLISLLKHSHVKIGLLTGSGGQLFPSKVNPRMATSISKKQLKRYIERGDIDILVGTHALIYKTVQFKRLGLVIIDEQHRFGVRQRASLARNKDGRLPHLLSMTATPIPRTLALTIFGTLDLSIIDELPPGRKPVESFLLTGEGRDQAYSRIKLELEKGRQAYVICARKEPADADRADTLELKSVVGTAEYLRKEEFPNYKIGELHGGMSAKKKQKIMEQFQSGDINILVSTTVVEVGVNVKNASTMLIEDAERYGLAQLHQLRGRILRAEHQPYCFVATRSSSEASIERLALFTKSHNGFELAELDLQRRGPGALIGKRQSGLSDIAMQAIQNLKLVKFAREHAQAVVESDPELDEYPDLKHHLASLRNKIHLE